MFNYSVANLESLNNDLDSTLEECKKLVENIKSSTNVNLNDFNDLENTVYDVSGRVAFLGDVHPEEKIRDFGNEADSKIQNFALEIFNDDDLYKKYNEIDISEADKESIEFHKDLGIDFKKAERVKHLFNQVNSNNRVQWEYINQKGYDFSNDNQLTENERELRLISNRIWYKNRKEQGLSPYQMIKKYGKYYGKSKEYKQNEGNYIKYKRNQKHLNPVYTEIQLKMML